MIRLKTVLILGAGASSHVGYPLGSGLVHLLWQRRGNPDMPDANVNLAAQDLITRMGQWCPWSVDAFLEQNPADIALGKFLMARELKLKEQLDALFPAANAGWYAVLADALTADGEAGFEKNNLAVITFNYDRSLEAFLHAVIMRRFRLDCADAAAVLAKLPIIHVHGILGTFPEFPYRDRLVEDELFQIASQIQIVPELNDRDSDFANQAFQQANHYLRMADVIAFLGFGFSETNLSRFQFFCAEAIKDKTVMGTVNGLSALEKSKLAIRVAPFGLKVQAFSPHNCGDFFKHSFTFE